MKKPLGLAIVMLLLALPGAIAANALEVNLGYSRVIGPVDEMATVIVGDHGVADATLGGGGTIILTGKALGVTNLIVLDGSGRELLSSPLLVVPLDRRPSTIVRVTNGVATARDYRCEALAGCRPVAGANAASAAAAMKETDEDAGDGTGDDTGNEPVEAPESSEPDAGVVHEQVSLGN